MSETAAAEPTPTCALCSKPLPEGPPRYVNHQPVCPSCEQQVLAELEGHKAGAAHYPTAVVAGLLGAVVGAGVWAAIGIMTKMEVGYIAVLVGFLAGYGVKLGARGKGGLGLQLVASALAVFGLLAAKFFIVSYMIVAESKANGLDVSYFDSQVFDVFQIVLPQMVNGFDILWVVLAIGAAFKIPAPPKVHVYGG
jgi:hypothetical protein